MRGVEIRKELRYNIGMKTLFTIKIDKMAAFNKVRKGPAGKGKFGGGKRFFGGLALEMGLSKYE